MLCDTDEINTNTPLAITSKVPRGRQLVWEVDAQVVAFDQGWLQRSCSHANVMAAVGSGLVVVVVFFLVSAPPPVAREGGGGACISTSLSSSSSSSSPKAEVDKTKEMRKE